MKKIRILFLAVILVLGGRTISYSGAPLLNFEGVGGGGIVPGAHLVNPPQDGKGIGKPAVMQWAGIRGDTNFYTTGFAFSLLDRFELGYTRATLDYNRIRDDVKRLSGNLLDPGKDHIYMDIFHLKTLILKEKEFLPAFAVTAEFKFNETIDDINNNLAQVLNTIGYDDDFGVDFDFSFSKIIPNLIICPIFVHFNIRLTRAAQAGFFGFSSDYTANPEISAGVLVRPDMAVGFEYRVKPDEYGSLALPGFTCKEDDMWDINFTYFPIERLSLSVAYCGFGNAANKDIDYAVFNAKFDF